MADVRSTTDPLTVDMFASKTGTPIVIDINAALAYFLDASNNIVQLGTGDGTVESVAASFTGGIVSISGSPITTSGTLAFTVAGTSGGIPYFSSASGWASSAALAQHGVVLGGGAGAAPTAISNLGSSGQVLTSNGAGVPPSFEDVSGGDVVGPASAVDGDIVLFDGVTGKLIKDGGTPADVVMNAGYWSCVGNGDLSSPEIVFDGDGAPVVAWVAL